MDMFIFTLLGACVGLFAFIQTLLAIAVIMGLRDLFAPRPVPVPVVSSSAPRRAA